ncbi:MAG: tetratricopeptide repeat protein [Desulfovibrionaceae bacterium]|nr:tetratricopeptide repeat protein [Desulfovibrionaceae bacterium]
MGKASNKKKSLPKHSLDADSTNQSKKNAAAPQSQSQSRSEAQAQSHPGYLKKEIAFGGMALCLVVGLILGSLLPAMLNDQNNVRALPKTTTQSAPPASIQPNTVDDRRIAELEMACAKDPKNQKAWVRLADGYFDARKADLAIKAYETALTLGPANPDILTDLGTMYRAQKNFSKARQLFQQAQALDPKHLQSRLNEGVVLYFDLNQKDQALAIWKNALALNPAITMPDGTPLAEIIKELDGK